MISSGFDRRSLLKYLAVLPLSLNGGPQEGPGEFRDDVRHILDRARQVNAAGVKLRIFYPKGSLGNLLPCCRIFEKQVGVKIELIEASLDEISSQLIFEHRLNRGQSYDVALPPTFAIPDLAAARVIAVLDDFAKVHELQGFSDSSLYQMGDRFLGRLYGYQADGDAYLMFLNRDWLQDQKAQNRYADTYSHPLEIPRTWQELDRQMRFFNAPQDNKFGGTLFRTLHYTVWEYWARLHAKGIYPFDDFMNPQLDSPAGIEALLDLREATASQAPDALKNGLFENFKSFAAGNKYCNLGWGGTQKYLRGPDSGMKARLQHCPLPGGLAGQIPFSVPYFNWGWNYVVLERSKIKELAYLFCLFASTAQISTLSIRDKSGYFDPHRLEHYEDPVIEAIYSHDFLASHKASMQNAIPDLYIQGYTLYMSALKHAILASVMNQIAPDKALKKVSARWNELTDKIGRDKQIQQWRYLKGRYPRTLQHILR